MVGSLLAVVLASHYVTYFVTRSEFPLMENVRIKIYERFEEGTSIAYLIGCPWCAGFWLSGLVVGLTLLFHDLPYPVLYWLAAASVGGILTEVVDTITVIRNERD